MKVVAKWHFSFLFSSCNLVTSYIMCVLFRIWGNNWKWIFAFVAISFLPQSLYSFSAQTANQISLKYFSCFSFCNIFIWSTQTCLRIILRCSCLAHYSYIYDICNCADWISLFSIWNSKCNLIVLHLCLVWYSTNIKIAVEGDEVKMDEDYASRFSLFVNNVLY